MKNAIVQEAAEMRSKVNEDIEKLLERISKLRDQKKEISKDTIRILAEKRQISLSGLYSWRIEREGNGFLDKDDQELFQDYIKACSVMGICQQVFRDFYESKAYDKICDFIAEEPSYGLGARAGNHDNDWVRNRGFNKSEIALNSNQSRFSGIRKMLKKA